MRSVAGIRRVRLSTGDVSGGTSDAPAAMPGNVPSKLARNTQPDVRIAANTAIDRGTPLLPLAVMAVICLWLG